MTEYFKMRPLLLSAIIISFVSIVGFYSRSAVFLCGIILILLFFVLLYIGIDYRYLFVIFITVLSIISILINYIKIDKANVHSGKTLRENFIITETPENHGLFYSSVIEANGCENIEDGTKILAFSDSCKFSLGDRIVADIELESVEEEYKASDYSEKIYLTGYMENITVVKDKGDYVLSIVNKIREYIVNTLFSNMDYEEAATVTAIVFGDRSYFSDQFYANTKAAGVTHVMVVSGMHLAIIVSLVTGICEKLFYNRYLKAVIIMLTVIFMSALCGFTKSISRAGVCYILYALSVVVGRDNNSENTLGGAVCLILIAEPFAIFSVSFELSVLSTLGIVAVAVPINRYLATKKPFNSVVIMNLIFSVNITLSALIFTLPIIMYIYEATSTVAVITNLLISYAVTVTLVLSAIALLIYAVIPILAIPLFHIAEKVTEYINYVINEFGSLPFAMIDLGKYGFPISSILLITIILVLFACKKRADMLKLKERSKKNY